MKHVATELAARGLRPFPVLVQDGTKKPLVRWKDYEFRADDPVWEMANAVGVAVPAGVVVVDLDGPEGLAAADEMMPEIARHVRAAAFALHTDDWPVVKTARGGFHVWTRCPGEWSQTSPAPGKIDVRVGDRGFVVVAGEGYELVTEDCPPGPLVPPAPECVQRHLKPAAEAPARLDHEAPAALDSETEARAREMYRSRLARYRHNQPSGEDHLRFTLACAGRDYGLTPAAVLEEMLRWNEGADYPRAEPEIVKAVTNAFRYAKSEAGHTIREAIHGLDQIRIEAGIEALRKLGAIVRRGAEIEQVENVRWFAEGLIPGTGVTFLYAAPKKGKTFAAVDLAMSAATRRPWLGQVSLPYPTDRPIVYLALEGAAEVAVRMRDWAQHYGIRMPQEVLLTELPGAATPEALRAAFDAIASLAPGLVVVDTFARLVLGLDENSARETSQLLAYLERWSSEINAPVVVVHHSGKDHEKGMRGSTAILAGAASAIQVDLADNVLGLKLTACRHAPAGAEIRATAETETGKSLVFGTAAASTEPPSRKAGQLQALIRAAASLPEGYVGSGLVSRDAFARLWRDQYYRARDWPIALLRNRITSMLEEHPTLRSALVCGDRIQLLPETERARLAAEVFGKEMLAALETDG